MPTNQLLMIRPVNFGFNAETAVNNAFQVQGHNDGAQERAAKEFDDFVMKLTAQGVDVTVVDDTPEPYTPDSVFPNNWVSFHADGTLVLYPMFATNRRQERKQTVLDVIRAKFIVRQTIDLSGFENKNVFLEGTGSMVLDRENRIAYACLSPRTSKEVLDKCCETIQYKAVIFNAVDANGLPIYHTNVLMCVADQYVVICLDAIVDQQEKEMVEQAIAGSGKSILQINFEQMNHFAGNMLQVTDKKGNDLLVMSSQAYGSLTGVQREELLRFNPILHSSLATIETNGGGSARCMMAEVYLPLLCK